MQEKVKIITKQILKCEELDDQKCYKLWMGPGIFVNLTILLWFGLVRGEVPMAPS